MCEIRDKLEAKQEVIFEYESERKDFMTYEIMLAEGSEVAKTQLIGINSKDYLLAQYLNNIFEDKLTSLARRICTVNCNCFKENTYIPAKSSADLSKYGGLYLIDNRGEIVVNQNCGMRLRILLQNLGFKVNFINKQCFLKLAQDFPV